MLRFLIIVLRWSAYFVRTTAGSNTVSSQQNSALRLRKYADTIAARIENHLCWITSGNPFYERLNPDQLMEVASDCSEYDCTRAQALDIVVDSVQRSLDCTGHIEVDGSIQEGVPVITAHPLKI